MRICVILEGCYPYVTGGVSTWIHQYMQAMPQHEFVVWAVGANARDRGKFKYKLPPNVAEVREIFLDEALKMQFVKEKYSFREEELLALREFVNCRRPDWETLFHMYHDKKVSPIAFLMSEDFLDILIKICHEEYPYTSFSDLFHTVRSMLLPKSQEDFHSQVRINALSCARSIAAGYKCNLAHSDQVGRFACRIFDKMKKAHGLDLQGRLILELAAILHDCGYYVNSKEHLSSTFNLIQNMDIYGITDEEMSYVAYAVRCSSYEPYHSEDYEENLYELSDETQLLVSKITAMFRLADALDKSQKQKLSDIRVKLDEHRLIITAESNENTLLEKWAFQHCASFFTDVFGIAPELLIKPLSLKVH